MTICIGLLSSEGIVIAADAHESDTYYKRPQGKIKYFFGGLSTGDNPPPPSMALALTGAGDAGYLDCFFDDLIKNVNSEDRPNEFQQYLSDKILDFHTKHLFPLGSYANPPEIQTIIGSYVRGHTMIYMSRGSAIRQALPCAAVGAGAAFALSLLSDFVGNDDLKRTEIIAAHVMYHTKDSIEQCGKFTSIASLRNHSAIKMEDGSSRLAPPKHPLTYVKPNKIKKWEDAFSTKWRFRYGQLFDELIQEEAKEPDE